VKKEKISQDFKPDTL